MENSLRSQLKATSIKRLQKQIDADNAMVGAQTQANEYLSLEDGKRVLVRIFPAHPGQEDFYVSKKSYWLSFRTEDGEVRRGTVLDSKVHGDTKWDVVEEYTKFAKKFVGNDSEKLDALVGSGPKSNSLNPQYSWVCYADIVSGDDPLRAKLWEFKKMVRDQLNKLAFSEDEDEVIEVDPFTDPDSGLPVYVTYRKNPNKKKGENYYEVSFAKQPKSRPLSDEEIEYFMSLRPLSEVVSKYGIKDFERAMEGLQNFDEDNDIGLFDDETWIAHLEEIKAQYDEEEEEEPAQKEEKKEEKKRSVKVTKTVDDELPFEETKKPVKKQVVDDDEEEEEDDVSVSDDLSDMDRSALKKYISSHGLTVVVKKSMTDEDLREAIRSASKIEQEEEIEEEEEEDDVPAVVTLDQIRNKLRGKR